MKKGIEVWTDYDAAGDWRLHIEKKKGNLTIDEIKDAAKEHDEDWYIMTLCCVDVEYEPTEGDHVILYKADLLTKL